MADIERKRRLNREYYYRNRDSILAKEKAKYAANPSVKWNVRNPIRARVKKYGMTEEDYLALLQAQDFKCAICGTECPDPKKPFHVDHDHETNKVRGLLCSNCNRALGLFKDDLQLLLKAIDYLQ